MFDISLAGSLLSRNALIVRVELVRNDIGSGIGRKIAYRTTVPVLEAASIVPMPVKWVMYNPR